MTTDIDDPSFMKLNFSDSAKKRSREGLHETTIGELFTFLLKIIICLK